MSCNGCRVLRKGCGQDCVLRPSLQWIKSPQSQANATLFLAKFYGRAGLISLINSGPAHLRSVILESLLYEACGRIIDPVHGSAGLMSSGNWPECQAAVAAVLRGAPPLIPASGEVDSSSADDGRSTKPVEGRTIRHLFKYGNSSAAPAAGLQRVKTRRRRFKRSARRHFDSVFSYVSNDSKTKFTITGWDHGKNFDDEVERASSHDSVLSVHTVEIDLSKRIEAVRELKPVPSGEDAGPDLSLSLSPLWHNYQSVVIDISDSEA